MKKWFIALLATTSLCHANQAKADLVWATQTGAFGQSFASPTALEGPSSTIYNDEDQYYTPRTADFFDVATAYTGFTLQLTASRVASDGNGGYYGLDQIDSYVGGSQSGSGSPTEGSSTITATALASYGGVATVTTPSGGGGSGASTEGVSLTVSASGNPAGPPSYTIPSAALDPILTFYDDAGDTLAIVEITEGNSILVSGTLSGQNDLIFSVSAPFDYDIQLDPTAVPEPASMALLGLGAAGAALARRRKRVI